MKLFIPTILLISAVPILGITQGLNASDTPIQNSKSGAKAAPGVVKAKRNSQPNQINSDLIMDEYGSLINSSSTMMIFY